MRPGTLGNMELLGADPSALIRTVVVGALAYVALLVMLRVSGKRTLSQLNAFDFVVTVALGSTLATILLSQDTTLLQGVVAFIVLIGMQFLITWSSLRSRTVARLVKSEPSLLVIRGQMLTTTMHRERLLPAEVQAALREHGLARAEDADLVVLETDGTISVVPSIDDVAWSSGELRSLVPNETGARSVAP